MPGARIRQLHRPVGLGGRIPDLSLGTACGWSEAECGKFGASHSGLESRVGGGHWTDGDPAFQPARERSRGPPL